MLWSTPKKGLHSTKSKLVGNHLFSPIFHCLQVCWCWREIKCSSITSSVYVQLAIIWNAVLISLGMLDMATMWVTAPVLSKRVQLATLTNQEWKCVLLRVKSHLLAIPLVILLLTLRCSQMCLLRIPYVLCINILAGHFGQQYFTFLPSKDFSLQDSLYSKSILQGEK